MPIKFFHVLREVTKLPAIIPDMSTNAILLTHETLIFRTYFALLKSVYLSLSLSVCLSVSLSLPLSLPLSLSLGGGFFGDGFHFEICDRTLVIHLVLSEVKHTINKYYCVSVDVYVHYLLYIVKGLYITVLSSMKL